MLCEKQYSIREVSERTGVKPVTLRAWQRRYHLIQPKRTEKGHRIYSAKDVDIINEIQAWLAKGVSIGKVKPLLDQEIGQENSSLADVDVDTPLEELADIMQSLADLNQSRLRNQLSALLREYPYSVVCARLIMPVLTALKQVKMSYRSLQYGLFQSSLITQFQVMIEAQNKAGAKHHALFISFKQPKILYEYLEALKLSERGYHITLINGVADIRGLLGHEVIDKYSLIYVYSDKSLTSQQLAGISMLKERYREKMELSETLDTLYFSS